MIDISKIGRMSITGIRKKFLEEEFQLVLEFVNKVLLPRSEKRAIASALIYL